MAQEEIKLVGSFKDDITPSLKKLNRELNTIARSFERFNKKIAPVTKSFAKMAMSARAFGDAMKSQRAGIETSARAMSEYSRQAGKMSGAMRKVTEQRIKAQRAMGMSRAQMRKGGGAGLPGGGGKGGAGAGAAYGASAAKGFNSGIGSIAIGSAIGNMASQAIMRGVEGLKNMALAPFKKFGDMFSERIGDEMDDIKSAGGLFALDMDLTQASGNERFFKNYNEALRFQEKLNIDMAQSAASLPGVTSQYVSTSRQLTDTIQMVMEKDREGFNKLAEGYGANISAGGVDASKEAMRTVLQKQTEQVMLQSQGQKGGLPMHIAIQQLMGKEQGKLNMTAFTNKFRAAFQKNPLLKNFLLRAQDDMNNTAAGSADRLKVIMETFDRAMPKEVINKMRGSISGMQEALRSGLLDPQAGLFGMSRANFVDGEALMKSNVDDFGRTLYKMTQDSAIGADLAKKMKEVGIDKAAEDSLKGIEFTAEQLKKLDYTLDKAGNIIAKDGKTIVGGISKSSTYIFEQIREILAGYGPVLLEFVGFLPSLFDPFGEMTKNLMGFRDTAQNFISGFNQRLDIIEDAALEFSNMESGEMKGIGAKLKGQSRARGAMDTVASLVAGLSPDDKGLQDLQKEIRAKAQDFTVEGVENFDFGDLIGRLLKATLESDLMKDFGKIGGIIVGGITKAVVDVIKMITGAAEGQMGNKLTEGFMEGIKTAFGDMSFNEVKSIIGGAVVSIISKSLDLLFTQVLPNLLQMYVGGLFKGLFSGNLITTIASAFGLYKLGAGFLALTLAAQKAAFSLATLGAGGKGRVAGRAAVGISQVFGKGTTKMLLVALPKIAKLFGKFVGPLAAVVTIISKLMGGAGVGEAFSAGAGAGIGGIAGAALGSLLGPIGTLLGGIVGAWLGEWIGTALAPILGNLWNNITGVVGNWIAFLGQELTRFLDNPALYLGQAVGTLIRFFYVDFPRMIYDSIVGGITAIITGLQNAWGNFLLWLEGIKGAFNEWMSGLESLPSNIVEALGGIGTAIIEWAKSLPGKVMASLGGAAGSFVEGVKEKVFPKYGGNFPVHSAAGGMNLGSAIATEMKHKPAGSDLVIANSSETIIPAGMTTAGGGGGINMGGVVVNVSGVDNPREIANQVAEEIMFAMQRATYSEINIS